MEYPHQNKPNWKLGMFYYNPDDKRVFVPKRNPAFGITLNFARRKSYLFLLVLLAALASFFILVSYVKHK